MIYSFKQFRLNESESEKYKRGSVICKQYNYGMVSNEYYEIIEYLGNDGKFDLYKAYQLKSNLTEVKSKKAITLKVFTESKQVKYRLLHVNDVLVSKDYEEHSNLEINSIDLGDNVPPHLMTLDKYKSIVGSLYKELDKFVKKNDTMLKYTYNNENKPLTKTELVSVNRISRVDDMVDATDDVIKQRDLLVSKIEDIVGVNLMDVKGNIKKDNKYFINSAIKNGVYEDLLLKNVINIKNVEDILSSVKLKVPNKLIEVSKNVSIKGFTKEKVDSYNDLMNKNLSRLKDLFKQYYDARRNGFIKYYTDIYVKLSDFSKNYNYINDDRFRYDYYVHLMKKEPPKSKYGRYVYDIVEITSIFDIKGVVSLVSRQGYVLNSNYAEIIGESATKYVDELFYNFNIKLCDKLKKIDVDVLPEVINGSLLTITSKSFIGSLELKYENGFVFGVEADVIVAGGYNIQTEHLRALFKYKLDGKFRSIDMIVDAYKSFGNLNESKVDNDIDIYALAWMCFILTYNDAKISIKNWKHDTRINGVPMEVCIADSIKLGYIIVDEEEGVYRLSDSGKKKVLKTFYRKDLDETLALSQSLKKYRKGIYDISTLPLNIWFIENPRIETNFYKIDEMVRYWHNTEKSIFLHKLSNNKYLKLYNKVNLYKYFDTNEIPNEIVVYRGLKSEFDASKRKEYESWTLDKNEAIRFAKYVFSKSVYNRFTPKYSKVSYVLETKIKLDDILVFIMLGEDEIVISSDLVKAENIKIMQIDNTERE